MSTEECSKKFRDERSVQIINKCISLKDADMKKNNEILHDVLYNVLDTMKKHDEFFRNHFQKLVFVGSYYKGTKVGKPEEFDVNLIIKLPVKYESIKFEKDMPGYTKLKLSSTDINSPKWIKHRKFLSKWITSDGYLNQDEFRQSMESLFQHMESLLTPKLPENVDYTVKVRKSGPAFTLQVTHRDSVEMSVDLVPVLAFDKNPLLPKKFNNVNWYAVPKPLKNGQDKSLNWRMSFYNAEKDFLSEYSYLKPVIRQMKKLRDTEDWKIIPSYHIETLFMHYMKEIEKNPDYKKLNGIKIFIDMLNRLKDVCENQKLTNFWDQNHNLIDAEKNQLASIVGRLGKLIKQINADPLTMANFILTKEEQVMYKSELDNIRSCRDSEKSDTHKQSNDENGTSFVAFCLGAAKTVMSTISQSETNNSPPPMSTNSNNESTEIIRMLKLMRNDILDLRNSVNMLSQRISAIEITISSSSLTLNT